MLGFIKKLFKKEEDPPPVALVSLETTPRILSREHVAQAVSRALGRPFEEVVEERFSYHRLVVEGYELTVMSMPQPYIPKDREPSRDLRLRAAIEQHEAAVLIDCWKAPEGHVREDATDLMGRILVELFDDSSLAVYCFHTQRLNLVDDTLVPMFREGKAKEAMETVTFAPIAGVKDDDERMAEAIAEARRRWPEFAAAFAGRKADDKSYLIKAPFGPEDRIEHMWVEVASVEGNAVTGELLNQAFGFVRPRKGDTVTVDAATVSDWVFSNEGGAIGMFSRDALER